jgi:N-methylhydantoinase A
VRSHRSAVPPAPGLFCAFGALSADARRDFIRSTKRVLDDEAAAAIARHFQELRRQAAQWLDDEGGLVASRSFAMSLDMRYLGQAYEINVDVADEAEVSQAALAVRFHDAHRRLHGFADPTALVEIHSVRVQAVGSIRRPPPARWRRQDAAAPTRRPVWQGDDWVDFQVVQRAGLDVGDLLQGPAVVEQADTTLCIPHGWTAVVTPNGSLMMEKK